MGGIEIPPEKVLKGVGNRKMDNAQPPILLLTHHATGDGRLSIPKGVGILQVGCAVNEPLAQGQLIAGEPRRGEWAEFSRQDSAQLLRLSEGIQRLHRMAPQRSSVECQLIPNSEELEATQTSHRTSE